jgi:hypothetical protein
MRLIGSRFRPFLTTRPILCAFLLLGNLMCSGCSGAKPLIPVMGQVKVKGKAAAGALVLFHPQENSAGAIASGVTEDDGTYTLVSGAKPGVETGNYRVTVTWPGAAKVIVKMPEGMMPVTEDAPDRLKGRYASFQSSDLKAEVASDTTVIPTFELN